MLDLGSALVSDSVICSNCSVLSNVEIVESCIAASVIVDCNFSLLIEIYLKFSDSICVQRSKKLGVVKLHFQ